MSTDKIVVKENKTLKLNNVLIRELSQNEIQDANRAIHMMQSYIKSKGNSIIGPMINRSLVQSDENGNLKLVVKFIFQLKNPIHDVEKPYKYENQIRVINCLFARFTEKEENLKFAYSKLDVYAFENNIKLLGDSYTVFVDKKEDDYIIADVFMETQNGGTSFASI
jgi:hypothetical protein